MHAHAGDAVGGGALHVVLAVPNHYGHVGRSVKLGKGPADERGLVPDAVRLATDDVEAIANAERVEHGLAAPLALRGGHGKLPAGGSQAVKQSPHAGEQRIALGAELLVAEAVAGRELGVVGLGDTVEQAEGTRERRTHEAGDVAHLLGRHAPFEQGLRGRLHNAGSGVGQRAVEVEEGKTTRGEVRRARTAQGGRAAERLDAMGDGAKDGRQVLHCRLGAPRHVDHKGAPENARRGAAEPGVGRYLGRRGTHGLADTGCHALADGGSGLGRHVTRAKAGATGGDDKGGARLRGLADGGLDDGLVIRNDAHGRNLVSFALEKLPHRRTRRILARTRRRAIARRDDGSGLELVRHLSPLALARRIRRDKSRKIN